MPLKVIDPDGDLILEVGNSHSTVQYKVWRRSVARTCAPWRVLLEGRFAESDQRIVTLPEDDPASVEAILTIAHLLFDKVPLRLLSLSAMAVLVDKYNLFATFTLTDTGAEPFFVAWTFGLEHKYLELARTAVYHLRIQEKPELDDVKMYEINRTTLAASDLPAEVLDRLVRHRQILRQALGKAIQRWAAAVIERNVCHLFEIEGNEDSTNTDEKCQQLLIGNLVPLLYQRKLLPVVHVDHITCSPRQFSENLADAIVNQLNDGIGPGDHEICIEGQVVELVVELINVANNSGSPLSDKHTKMFRTKTAELWPEGSPDQSRRGSEIATVSSIL